MTIGAGIFLGVIAIGAFALIFRGERFWGTLLLLVTLVAFANINQG